MAGDAAHNLGPRVSSLEQWRAEHGKGCELQWKHQHEFNEGVDERLDGHATAIRSLQDRMLWAVGFAAGIGGLLGGGGITAVVEIAKALK